jgi:hypothetical protein
MTWLLSLRYVFLVLLATVAAVVLWSALTGRNLD